MSVYLDHAATTPLHPAAREAWLRATSEVGNPASIHAHGQRSRGELEAARERIARTLGAQAIETVFTSGGTESNNLAIKGLWWARNRGASRPVILTTRTEHHATLDAVEWLVANEGAEVEWLAVDGSGLIDLPAAAAAIARVGDRGALLTTLHGNNEIGTLQPVRELAQLCEAEGIPMHVDAVASYGQLPVSLRDWGIAALSVSAHKIGGPVGVGALAVSRHVTPEALLHGGGQQRGIRSGTQDVGGVLAFAAVAETFEGGVLPGTAQQSELRDRLIAGIRDRIPDGQLHGPEPGPLRLPLNAHFTFPGCQGDSLLFLLDMAGISVSTGSACQAGIPEPSHVLLGCGFDEATARGALRFTLGHTTTAEDIGLVLEALPAAVAQAKKAGLSNRAAPRH
ncbi:cysteine desulfurase family protein [Gulosibacter molinativorax]|uniref:Cysteine desulfurase n=1 Tax=Gulosibacter molinativorax TaxID=256821 RepID=A0ABT7CDE8_9MICO|nr:cysteine desulfurase family protein [Gulosibacter molinativorax]MDJ1372642.1 cysteine desulfurase [Gulosibacter molinativorax]QUY60770.1 Cysteine desulfurase [Gulosibacter molinativorax]